MLNRKTMLSSAFEDRLSEHLTDASYPPNYVNPGVRLVHDSEITLDGMRVVNEALVRQALGLYHEDVMIKRATGA